MHFERSGSRGPRTNALTTRLFVLVILSAARGSAQNVLDSVRTANGYCHIWQPPPGFSNPPDYSYSACAIDRPPKRLSGPDLPAPTLGQYAGGSVFIAVRPDGSVDSALTRRSTITGDTSFDNRVLETVRRWRFEQPLRNGVPVRTGRWLEITSTSRDDTLPAHLEWRYITGRETDSAVARWVVDDARPQPLTAAQGDSVYAEVIRQLVRLQVLLPLSRQRYCLVAPTGDTTFSRRLETVAHAALPAFTITALGGCERDPAFVRLVMPRIYRTERNRVVLFPRGDILPAWPPGLDAKSWRAWTGRCVGRVFDDAPAAMSCGVNPIMSMAEGMSGWRPSNEDRVWVDGDSVRLAILATRAGAFLVDTFHVTAAPLPILEQHAVLDSLVPCGGWAAYTKQSDSVFIVHGSIRSSSLQISLVDHRAPPSGTPRRDCPRRASTEGPFAAFFLGGIGATPTLPVHLCFSNCASAYDIDPRRHTLASAPVAVIRVADLRHETQLGMADVMRIIMEHGPPDAAVLVVYGAGAHWPQCGLIARQTSSGQWDFTVSLDGGRLDAEYWVYLFRRR